MRITNSMIRNNSLWNINKNEVLMSKLDAQYATGKKIQKPSDDPIVAVRALKFRNNVKEVTQYRTNAEDAISWLGVGEQAIKNTVTQLKRARDLCVTGATGTYSAEDKANIIAELDQIKIQLMNEGNVNYAGRYVFSGYKTDKPLVYTEDTEARYSITESFSKGDIEVQQKVITDNVAGETQIKSIYRLRLGYSDVVKNLPATIAGIPITSSMKSTDVNAYEPGSGEVYFLEDTGELIFHKDDAEAFPTTEISFSYDKTSFLKGDMVPEHYFDCTNWGEDDTAGTPDDISYTKPTDEMRYQIGYNQDISVNTLGRNVFTVDLARDLEEIAKAVNNIQDSTVLEERLATAKELGTQADIDAAQLAMDENNLKKDLLGSLFSKLLGKSDIHIDRALKEQAIIGGKINRLDLTINRLKEDKINFTDLKSLNEDANLAEVIINLKAQELVYNASMQSAAMLMKQTLMDFLR